MFRTNITGLQRLLAFMEGGFCSRIHATSTAYVGGDSAPPCKKVFSPPHGFFNPYEESKHRAEILLWEFCSRWDVRLFIYRPSVVYWHTRTDKTFSFNALYHPVRCSLLLF